MLQSSTGLDRGGVAVAEHTHRGYSSGRARERVAEPTAGNPKLPNPLVGEAEVVQNDRDFADILVEPNIDVHDLFRQLPRVGLEAQIQELDFFQLLGVV